MRKRTVTHIAKTAFWSIVAWLPIIGYLCVLLGHGENVPVLTYLADYTVNASNPVYTMLLDLFGGGSNAILPIFTTTNQTAFLSVFAWYISVVLIRCICEFVLFLPKMTLKLVEGFVNDENW